MNIKAIAIVAGLAALMAAAAVRVDMFIGGGGMRYFERGSARTAAEGLGG